MGDNWGGAHMNGWGGSITPVVYCPQMAVTSPWASSASSKRRSQSVMLSPVENWLLEEQLRPGGGRSGWWLTSASWWNTKLSWFNLSWRLCTSQYLLYSPRRYLLWDCQNKTNFWTCATWFARTLAFIFQYGLLILWRQFFPKRLKAVTMLHSNRRVWETLLLHSDTENSSQRGRKWMLWHT